jgi:hypothetical protein
MHAPAADLYLACVAPAKSDGITVKRLIGDSGSFTIRIVGTGIDDAEFFGEQHQLSAERRKGDRVAGWRLNRRGNAGPQSHKQLPVRTFRSSLDHRQLAGPLRSLIGSNRT